MKSLTLLICLLLLTISAGNAITVTAQSARDTVSLPFLVCDSVGNATDLTTGDSVYISVFSPGGSIVFKDSAAYNAASIKYADWQDFSGGRQYIYSALVQTLIGSSSSRGVFAWIITADDNTGADLTTTSSGWIQVVNSPLETSLDSAGTAARLASNSIDSLNLVLDSLHRILDSLYSHDDWIAQPAIAGRKLAVDASGRLGIDLDNVGGTLDPPEINPQTFTVLADTLWSRDTTAITIGIGAMLKDTTAYQGTAVISEIDKQEIAGYVEDTLSAHHSSGSWASSAAGSGAYSVGLVAVDSIPEQTVGGVTLAVYDVTQTSLKAVVGTDASGRASANLDADTHLVVATAPGYVFRSFDTVIVSGAVTDTIFGHQFDPGIPAAPDLCRVWGFVYDLRGLPDNGATVSAYLPGGVMQSQGVIVTPVSVNTATDSTGYFALDLFPSDLLYPSGSLYEITISHSNGTFLRRRVSVPQASSWRIDW